MAPVLRWNCETSSFAVLTIPRGIQQSAVTAVTAAAVVAVTTAMPRATPTPGGPERDC